MPNTVLPLAVIPESVFNAVTKQKQIYILDPISNEAGTAITNREKLDSLLTFLYRNETLFNMIVCDLDFHFPSMKPGVDSSLLKSSRSNSISSA